MFGCPQFEQVGPAAAGCPQDGMAAASGGAAGATLRRSKPQLSQNTEPLNAGELQFGQVNADITHSPYSLLNDEGNSFPIAKD